MDLVLENCILGFSVFRGQAARRVPQRHDEVASNDCGSSKPAAAGARAGAAKGRAVTRIAPTWAAASAVVVLQYPCAEGPKFDRLPDFRCGASRTPLSAEAVR